MIQAIIFDMDGVLIDSEPFWRQAEIKIFSSLGITLTEKMLTETTGIRIDEVLEFRFAKNPWKGKTLTEVQTEILNEMEQLVNQSGVVMEGVHQALDFFESKQLKIGLASSSPSRFIYTVLDKLKIRDRFEVICSAEYEPYGKPHPAIYLSAAQRLNLHPTTILAIEDSFNGLLAAKAARMKTLVVPESHLADQPRWVIADQKLSSLADFSPEQWQTFIDRLEL